MKCSTGRDTQSLPGSETFAANLSLRQLQQALSGREPSGGLVYCYIIATVTNENGHLRQRGSGPNFDGGMITLCTCKHYMRTFQPVTEWPGKWVAGFTGVQAGNGRNALVYLMQVGHAFESHHDLWFSSEIPDSVKKAKLASHNILGDLFKPIQPGDPFDPHTYEPPHPEHSHLENGFWHKDIDYRRKGRPAALLVGEPRYSFRWDKPLLFYSGQLHRGQKKLVLGHFLQHLATGELA